MSSSMMNILKIFTGAALLVALFLVLKKVQPELIDYVIAFIKTSLGM